MNDVVCLWEEIYVNRGKWLIDVFILEKENEVERDGMTN